MDKTLGQLVVAARRSRRKTLRSLAREVDISAALLSLIERDKHRPPSRVITRLAGALGGDADQWCGLAGRIAPDIEANLAGLAKEDPESYRLFLRTLPARGRLNVESTKSR